MHKTDIKIHCKICGDTATHVFSGKVLGQFEGMFFRCELCGFVFLHNAEEWLPRAYDTPINLYDTGILTRNIALSQISANILYFCFGKDGKYLDYAGGYGILTRLMRDIGFDFYWFDPYCENIFAKGFEYDPTLIFNGITAFECFEHFHNPLEEIEKVIGISKNILFSTEILPSPLPQPGNWWYYGLEHGQHISFYTVRSLKGIAGKFGLNFFTNGRNFHLFTENKSINTLLFRQLIKRHRFIFSIITRKKVKSKTFTDYEYLSGLKK